MIQIMLVDDELWMRTKIKSIMDWESMGYHICAEFSDGDSAVRYLKTDHQHVQILITDIKMSRMNGDELVEIVHDNYPEICTIVLSGYDDYEYVRSTMKHGALDYLVKSDLSKEGLLEVLKSAGDHLGQKSIYPSEDNLLQLRNKFVQNLITGLYNKDDFIKNSIQSLGLTLDTRNVTAIILLVENYRQSYWEMPLKEKTLFDFTIQNIVDEILNEEAAGLIGNMENGEFVMVMSFGAVSSHSEMKHKISDILTRIGFCLKRYLNKSASFVVGSIGPISEVEKSYQRGKKQAGEIFYQKEGSILFYDESSERPVNTSDLKLSLTEEQNLQKAVKSGDKTQVQQVIGDIFDHIEKQRASKQKCMRIFNDLLIMANRICRKNKIEMPKISDVTDNVHEYLLHIEKIEIGRELFEIIFEKIVDQITRQKEEKKYSIYTQKALVYMEEHFRENITQADIAESIGISSSYLSMLFKQDMGIGCKEYLLDLKLSYAKQRIDEGGKLKDIVEQSGISNYPYFFRLFKNKYGLTPKEYIKEMKR